MLSNRIFVDSLLFGLVQLGSLTWWFDVICLVNQMCTHIWKCFPHYTENESGFLLRWFCEISPCLLVMSIKHCKRCRSFIRTGTSLVKWLVCHLGSRGPRLLVPTTTTLVVVEDQDYCWHVYFCSDTDVTACKGLPTRPATSSTSLHFNVKSPHNWNFQPLFALRPQWWPVFCICMVFAWTLWRPWRRV